MLSMTLSWGSYVGREAHETAEHKSRSVLTAILSTKERKALTGYLSAAVEAYEHARP